MQATASRNWTKYNSTSSSAETVVPTASTGNSVASYPADSPLNANMVSVLTGGSTTWSLYSLVAVQHGLCPHWSQYNMASVLTGRNTIWPLSSLVAMKPLWPQRYRNSPQLLHTKAPPFTHRHLRCAVSRKFQTLQHMLDSKKRDTLTLTEAKRIMSIQDDEICANYTIYHHDWHISLGHGGGLLIRVANTCPARVNNINRFTNSDILLVMIEYSFCNGLLCVYYHHPIYKDVEDVINGKTKCLISIPWL